MPDEWTEEESDESPIIFGMRSLHHLNPVGYLVVAKPRSTPVL